MQCPVCTNTSLVMSERAGIEIDYCPQCRGVWLDRGELDKIIERSAATPMPSAPPTAQSVPSQAYPPSGGHDAYRGDPYRKKRKEGFLSELFDFD